MKSKFLKMLLSTSVDNQRFMPKFNQNKADINLNTAIIKEKKSYLQKLDD
jgi:hypothetical protein